MAYMFFDETIRENGKFIIGALVISRRDLSPIVEKEWLRLGLDPKSDEYKSSDPKEKNPKGKKQRHVVAGLLMDSELALTVMPTSDRAQLGAHCTELILQLRDTGFLNDEGYELYLDQNIKLLDSDSARLQEIQVSAFPDSDSKAVAGIQVADHAAHALGGMLLEEMGILVKKVRAGEGSGYHPDDLLELGFELWASLRYALIGRNEYIEGLSAHPEDEANPYFRVDGVGLYVAPSCSEQLSRHARQRFGVNYLGCIH